MDTQTPRGSGPRSGPAPASASFDAFDLAPPILKALDRAGFTAPRPIQAGTLGPALDGRDIMGLAQTGTGKTAAFALPLIERLRHRPGGKRPDRSRALVLAPTRELATQIHDELVKLARFTQVTATTVFGGVGAGPQVRALRKAPDVIVACPGRLLDLLGSGDVRLDGVEALVLDEADHMLDMGFLPDIKRILARLPKRRQNMLFSATMPKEIRSLAQGLLHDAALVELAVRAPVETIEHALYPVRQHEKQHLLKHLLAEPDFTSAIVFLRTKHRAKRLAQVLDRAGHRAVALQGNMSQGQRVRAMEGFRKGDHDVLVATDIAARGIDVAGVSHVINFDVPDTPDAYTHRIGRTGRAERSGRACTFVTHDDFPAIKDIERKLDMQIPRVKLAKLGLKDIPEPEVDLERRGRKARGGGGGPRGRQGGGKPGGGKLGKRGRKRVKSGGGRGAGGSRSSAVARPAAKKPKRSVSNVGRRPR